MRRTSHARVTPLPICFSFYFLFLIGHRGGKATGVRVSGGAASVVRAVLGHLRIRGGGLCCILRHTLGVYPNRTCSGAPNGTAVSIDFLCIVFVLMMCVYFTRDSELQNQIPDY